MKPVIVLFLFSVGLLISVNINKDICIEDSNLVQEFLFNVFLNM